MRRVCERGAEQARCLVTSCLRPPSTWADFSFMRELLHIQGGQCDNQIGAKFWEVIWEVGHQGWCHRRTIDFCAPEVYFVEVHLDAFFVAVEAWGSLRRRPMQGRTSTSTGPTSLRPGRFGSHVGLVSAGPLRELRLEELQGYVVDTPLESEVLLHYARARPCPGRSVRQSDRGQVLGGHLGRARRRLHRHVPR